MSDFRIGGPSCPLVVNALAARNRLKRLGYYDEVIETMAMACAARSVCENSCVDKCMSVDPNSTICLGDYGETLVSLANSFGEISGLALRCGYSETEEEVA